MVKYFKFIPWVIIIVLLSVMSIYKCSRDTHVEKPFDSTSIFKARLAESIAREDEQKKEWKNDSIKMETRVQRLNKTVSVITKQRDHARKIAQIFIDSIPEVKQFVALDDSVDRINLAIIDTLKQDKREMGIDFRNMVLTKENQKKILHELVLHLEATNIELGKKVKRERLKKTFWQVAAGIAVTGLVFSSFNN